VRTNSGDTRVSSTSPFDLFFFFLLPHSLSFVRLFCFVIVIHSHSSHAKNKHRNMTTLSAQPRFLRSITLDRANKFSSTDFYSDINLYSKLYSKRSSEAVELSVYSVPDLKRIPFKKAVKQSFSPTSTGTSYGPSWVHETSLLFLCIFDDMFLLVKQRLT
jgi:hypothetical protein